MARTDLSLSPSDQQGGRPRGAEKSKLAVPLVESEGWSQLAGEREVVVVLHHLCIPQASIWVEWSWHYSLSLYWHWHWHLMI